VWTVRRIDEVEMKIQTFWDVTPRRVIISYERFEGWYCQVRLKQPGNVTLLWVRDVTEEGTTICRTLVAVLVDTA